MDIRIKFLGGAGTVTGSKYLVEIDDFRLLVDCGMFQGPKELRLRNWDAFPVDPKSISMVLITHAHIDHTGYLPRLLREGFSGRIICTEATQPLMNILLQDAGRLQEEEARFARKKGYSKHSSPQPLFTEADARNVSLLVEGFPYQEEISLTEFLRIRFTQAGHILGAAIISVKVTGANQSKTIVFSGDLGSMSAPLHFPPKSVSLADVLLVESTYGNRSLDTNNVEEKLRDVVLEVEKKGGCLVIPAFSVGRTQLLLYYFWKLLNEKRIPDWPIFIDSPMAISVTQLYKKYDDLHQLNDIAPDHYVFEHPNFKYVRHQTVSQALNERKGNCVIISASGMCTGGRILHHLFHRLPRPSDTILFTGYQAEGTRGRKIQEGENEIKIFGELIQVKASIRSIEGLSAHGDREDLHKWINGIEQPPKMTFIVHGENESATSLLNFIKKEKGWNAYIPLYQETFQLFQGV